MSADPVQLTRCRRKFEAIKNTDLKKQIWKRDEREMPKLKIEDLKTS